MPGTQEEGDRFVLITEEVFMSMVEELSEHQDREFEVEWGEPIFGTHTYYSPTVYVHEDEEAAPEPTT